MKPNHPLCRPFAAGATAHPVTAAAARAGLADDLMVSRRRSLHLKSLLRLLVVVIGCCAIYCAPAARAQVNSLPGLAPLSQAGGAVDPQKEIIVPTARYHHSIDAAALAHDLGSLELPAEENSPRLRVGVVRPVELQSGAKSLRLQNPDGTEVAVLVIRSPGAVSLRMQFKDFDLPAGDEVYVRSTHSGAAVAGPYSGKGPWENGEFWSGSVDGDTLVIEHHARGTDGAAFTVAGVSHIYSGAADDPAPTALSCHVDASCSPTGPREAVGRIRYVSGGTIYVCTGTLLNNTSNDRTPYFLTAQHCVGTQAEAQTVEAWWLYQTTSCNSNVVRPDWIKTSSGADLLASSVPADSTLLRMRDPAPAAVGFAGWTDAVQPVNATVFGLHHPDGAVPPSAISYLRQSHGWISSSGDSCSASGLSNGYGVDWSSGVTEPGSSGSALFVTHGGQHYVVGVASCGPATPSCSNRWALYGRFSSFLPQIRQFLEPAGPLPPPVATAAANVTSNSFMATWTSSSGAYGYRIDLARDANFTDYLGSWRDFNVSNFTSYTFYGLSPATTYYYRVRAYLASGTTSANSNVVSQTTLPPMINVTVSASPAAATFVVDGVSYTGTRFFTWPVGSTHTIAGVSPQEGSGTRYTWNRWSNGGPISQTVAPTTGTTYTVFYDAQHFVAVNGTSGGSVSPGSGWHDAGAQLTLQAVADPDYTFVGWTGSGAGSYTGPAASPTITVNGPIDQLAAFSSGPVRVTVNTEPAGIPVMVDGHTYNNTQLFDWMAGSTHSLSVAATRSADSGSVWVWTHWNNGGALSHTVTPWADTTYTAHFQLEHILYRQAGVGGWVTATPAREHYPPGTSVQLNAISSFGWFFAEWIGTGPGSYSGQNNPATVTMNGFINQLAKFRRPMKPFFNTHGNSDVVWENAVTGQRAIWLMNGPLHAGERWLPTVAPEWQIATTGDMNLDGQIDLVWQNRSTGQRAIWLMNGAGHVGERWLPVIGVEWEIVGTGDFNGDGFRDLVWQNRNTGQRAIWFMHYWTFSSEAFLPDVALEWDIVSVADFDENGKPDLLWRNKSTGQTAVWLMNGTQRVAERSLPTIPVEWKIAGTGDFNGDGHTDIIWQHTSGMRAIWLMRQTGHIGERWLPTIPPEWSIRNH
jgi:uncharacterized repeat protein (TIGR02543 family)